MRLNAFEKPRDMLAWRQGADITRMGESLHYADEREQLRASDGETVRACGIEAQEDGGRAAQETKTPPRRAASRGMANWSR